MTNRSRPVRHAVSCAFGLSVLLLSVTGCQRGQRPVYPVTGEVKFGDGSPAMFGDIEFRSESAPPHNARGKIQRDGTFMITSLDGRIGTVEGWQKVVIMQVVGNPLRKDIVHNHGQLVARKYASYQSTDLRVNVAGRDENNFVILVEPLTESDK